MISFEVSADDLQTIRNAHMRQCVSDADPVNLGELLRAFANEVYTLEFAMEDIMKAIDADPATYPTTTMKRVRDIAAKALGEKGESDAT